MNLKRLAALCGLLTPTITLALIFIAIKLSPWFSWHDNALSDMGVSATPNPFNAALLKRLHLPGVPTGAAPARSASGHPITTDDGSAHLDHRR